MSALPQLQDIDDNPLSDENLEAKEQERQDRARASLERLGLAGQMTIRRSKYAPLKRSSESEVEDTSIDQPVRVSENDNVERQQVGLLTRIWSVLSSINKTLEQQAEFEEDQSIEDREKSLETVQGEPQRIDDKKGEGDGGMGEMIKMLLAGFGIELAPVIASIAGLGVTLAAVSAFLKVPAVKEWQDKGGAIGFIGDKTGLWKGNPIHDALPDWMKTDLLTGKVDSQSGDNNPKQNRVRVVKALKGRGFNDREIAQVMGQIDAESKFKSRSEDISYSRAQAQYQNNKHLGNKAPGDGYRYRGRGLNQLTGRANYVDMDKKLGLGGRLVANPDLANDPNIAARIVAQFYTDRRNFKNVRKNGGLETAAGATTATAPGGNRAQQIENRGRAANKYTPGVIEALAGVKEGVQQLKQATVVMKDSVVKAVSSSTRHANTKPGVGVDLNNPQTTVGKTFSGLMFGAELKERNTWARSKDLRDLKTPELDQKKFSPAPMQHEKGIIQSITNLIGGHKGQRAPQGIDSTGGVPSPDADTVSLNYQLYFHTGPDHT